MTQPVLSLHKAGMDVPVRHPDPGAPKTRTLWNDLSLDVQPGEFIAVLGPNGCGKSTLFRAILGLTSLTRGRALVNGEPVHKGLSSVGYIPQQRTLDADLPMRGRDLIQLGIDGHKWGCSSFASRRRNRAIVQRAIDEVDAQAFADRPVGTLSDGEQQRIRAAQALVANPTLLLCDEPLLSLDLTQQKRIVELIARQARDHHTAVLFITHEINPVLPYVDRVLYLTEGDYRIGPVDDVMTTESLTALFHSPITVARVAGQIVVVGTEDAPHQEADHHA